MATGTGPTCKREGCGEPQDEHEDGEGACARTECPAYVPACIYCGDTRMVLEGDTEHPCGACYEPDDIDLRGEG